MKTKMKNSLGSIVTSSMLTLALAAGMLPAAGLAYAAEPQDADAQPAQEQTTEDEISLASEEAGEPEAAEKPAITTNLVNIENQSDASAAENAGSENSAATDNAEQPAATDNAAHGAENAVNMSQAPVYNNAAEGITSAQVPLTPIAEKPQAVGSVEFGGIRYTINQDDPTTVAATGLASTKPEGDVQIQSQVAISGALYTVTSIKNSLGGGGQ